MDAEWVEKIRIIDKLTQRKDNNQDPQHLDFLHGKRDGQGVGSLVTQNY